MSFPTEIIVEVQPGSHVQWCPDVEPVEHERLRQCNTALKQDVGPIDPSNVTVRRDATMA